MLFHVQGLEYRVNIHPSGLQHLIRPKNVDVTWEKMVGYKAWVDLQFKFDPDLGHMIQLQRLGTIGKGVIQPQTGFIQHIVTYDAIFQNPIIGEVIDAVISKVGVSNIVFSFMGVINGIVPYDQFPVDEDYELQEKVIEGMEGLKKVRVFVSVVDTKKNFKAGAHVRLRITQRAFGTTGYWLTGSMKNKFLGVRVPAEKQESLPDDDETVHDHELSHSFNDQSALMLASTSKPQA